MTKWIDADALLRMISDTRHEMFSKKELKELSATEFYIRDTMLTNFEQLVRLASKEQDDNPGLTAGECSPARGERDEEDTDIV